jgi:hypothetical protein
VAEVLEDDDLVSQLARLVGGEAEAGLVDHLDGDCGQVEEISFCRTAKNGS